MNDDAMQDLKQMIAATVRQKVSTLRDDIAELEIKLENKVDVRSDEILTAIADTTNPRFETVENNLDELDRRVTKLETKTT